MNAPAPHAVFSASAPHLIVTFAPSTTRTQARRRARFGKEELAELAANVKAVGIMQPIVARPHPKPIAPVKYEIVAGERRWLAASLAGLIEIPAIIRDVADADLITLQLTENLQRKTIDQLEEAEAYDELRKAKKITADQVADLLGTSRSTVFNRLKLLDLAPEAREMLDEGKITPSVALLVARLPDPKLQAKAAAGCANGITGDFEPEETMDGPLTYNDAERYIKEEFTARIEGAAAINKAKSEGKSVITGKEAESIWKSYHGSPNGYIDLAATYWLDTKRRSYSAVLGDNPPGIVLIQSPHTGAAVKCLPRADVIRIFNEKKVELPHELQPRGAPAARKPGSPAAAAKAKDEAEKEREKRAREERKAQLDIDIRIAVFKAVRAKAPAKLGKPELIELLGYLEDAYAQVDRLLCPRGKTLANCNEKELARICIEQLYGPEIDDSYYNSKPLFAAAKRYGVNVAKIQKEMTTAAVEKLKAQASAPKKKAKKK